MTPLELPWPAAFYTERNLDWKQAWLRTVWMYIQATNDYLPGWLTKEEANFLLGCSRYMNPGIVVELGSYCGKSSRVLAAGCLLSGSRLWCVDTLDGAFDGECTQLKDSLVVRQSYDYLLHSITQIVGPRTQHVTIWRETSSTAAEIWKGQDRGPVDVLFIDADHSRARQDFEAWLPTLADHAMVIFHDVVGSHAYGVDGPDNTVAHLLYRNWKLAYRVDRTAGITRDPYYWVTLEEREIKAYENYQHGTFHDSDQQNQGSTRQDDGIATNLRGVETCMPQDPPRDI